MKNGFNLSAARKAVRVAISASAFLTTAVLPMVISSTAEAQYYGRPPRLFCSVAPQYKYVRGGCPVGGWGKGPGQYCECRAYSYGPTVPGVIVVR